MIQNYFGKAITRRFYPMQDMQPVNLPTQTPAIYLFDAFPSRTAAADGSGAIATISSWTENTNAPYARTFTIPAVDDPRPESQIAAYEYFVAVNYTLESAEQTQTKIEAIIFERADAVSEIPETTKADLKALYPAIEKYISDEQLDDFLGMATDQLQADLRNKGYQWGLIQNLSDLRLALAYKTIALSTLSQMRDPSDRHKSRFDIFSQWYESALNSVTLKHDTDADGRPDTAQPAGKSYLIVSK